MLKEKRKVREERMLARPGGSGASSSASGSKAELQRKVQQQAAELRKLQESARRPADEGGAGEAGGRGRGRGRG